MVALGRAEYNGTFGKKRGLTREEVVTESKVWQLKTGVFPGFQQSSWLLD